MVCWLVIGVSGVVGGTGRVCGVQIWGQILYIEMYLNTIFL